MTTTYINGLNNAVGITVDTDINAISTPAGTFKTDESILEIFDNDGDLLTIAGGLITVFQLSVETITTTTHSAANFPIILCDATSNAITVNLPQASTSANLVYNIKKIDSTGNTVTIDGNASETIDGATTSVLATQYDSATIVCDGSNWFIL